MEKRSNDELLGELQRLDNLPPKEVKQELEKLKMKFSEWQRFTNENLGYFWLERAPKEYIGKFTDKVDISYEEYLNMQHVQITREYLGPRYSNIASTARQSGTMTEEQISTLEQIETLWENIRAKYNPVQEVTRSAKQTSTMFKSFTTSEGLAFGIEEVKRNISQIKKATGYIGESKELDEECLQLEDDLTKAIEEGLRVLEKLQDSLDLSADEIMDKFGIDKEEVNAYFKKRMEMAAEGKSNEHSIRAYEGRGFDLNEEGELEVIDKKAAKDLIIAVFFRQKVLRGQIESLDKATQLEMLIENLPEKKHRKKQKKNTPKKPTKEYEEEYIGTPTEKYGEEYPEKPTEEYSEESISELMQRATENDRKIVDNDKIIRQALKERILRQQQKIKEQNREIARLRGEKSNEK